MIKFYGYNNCDTCRKAKKQLVAWGVAFEDIDITTQPPSKKLLGSMLAGGDYALKELFNRSGQEYRKLNMKERLEDMATSEAIELLAGNGRLVKRPIVSDGKRHTVGYVAERFEVWKRAE